MTMIAIQRCQNGVAWIIAIGFGYSHTGISTVRTLGLLTFLERRYYLILITL